MAVVLTAASTAVAASPGEKSGVDEESGPRSTTAGDEQGPAPAAPPVVWSPGWPRFAPADWVITGAGAAIALTMALVPPQPRHSLEGGIAFDDSARDALRAPTSGGRNLARTTSDVLVSLELAWPVLGDALVTTWWHRKSPDAAAQMALIDAEALAIVTAVQGATNTLVSRERPYGQLCGAPSDASPASDCEGSGRYRSFFSGHASVTFTAASLMCVHHQKLGLYGATGDAVACATAYAGAAATATLRIVGDMHYASDVLVGASVGTLVGLAVPLLHYRRVGVEKTANGAENTPRKPVSWSVAPVGMGLGVAATF